MVTFLPVKIRPVYGCRVQHCFPVLPTARLLLFSQIFLPQDVPCVLCLEELNTLGGQELPCTWEPCKPEQLAKATGDANVGEPPSSSFFLSPPGTCVSINASKQLSAASSFCGSVQLAVSKGNSSCSGPRQLPSQTLIPAVHPVSYFVA